MIESIEQLEQWFKFAVSYARGTKDDTRRPFDTAAQRANPLFTPEFTDDALVLFDKVIAAPPPPPTTTTRGR